MALCARLCERLKAASERGDPAIAPAKLRLCTSEETFELFHTRVEQLNFLYANVTIG